MNLLYNGRNYFYKLTTSNQRVVTSVKLQMTDMSMLEDRVWKKQKKQKKTEK